MLRWRLLVGALLIVAVVLLAWLDHWLEIRFSSLLPGICLFPIGLVCLGLATNEALALVRSSGLHPRRWSVYSGNALLLLCVWLPVPAEVGTSPSPAAAAAWPLFGLALGLMLVVVSQMRSYEGPGGVIADTAGSLMVLLYVGMPFCFLGLLRVGWGVGALASLVIVVKAGDIGAYTVGRLLGRNKMAPVLSPGKTIEGALGAFVFSCLAAWATFRWLTPLVTAPSTKPAAGVSPWWGWLLFGLLVAGAGMIGDLAESLLKRDAKCKDSSTWLPGLGGVLDILDSILLAAPVAWLMWGLGLVR